MLDPEITELAGRMIAGQFEERNKQLDHDITKAREEATLSGMGSSGPVVQLVYEQCARDIDLRLQIVWQNLYRVLSHAGVVLTDKLADDLKSEVLKYVDAVFDDPNNRYQKVVKNTPIGKPRQLTEARDRAYAKVNAEIDLFVLGLRRQEEAKKSESGAVFNFYSPVGAVQTGPNAMAMFIGQSMPKIDRHSMTRW